MKNRISMKKNWKARLVSGLLSLAMVASLLPAGLFTLPAQAAGAAALGEETFLAEARALIGREPQP